MRREDSAQIVWDVLLAAQKAGEKLPWGEIVRRSGLTWGQCRYGYDHIRANLQEYYVQPITCQYVDGTYRHWLPDEVAEALDGFDFVLRGLLTRAMRLESSGEASCRKWGRRGKLRLVMRQITRLREDLEEAVA